jgi:hypothetical protein
MKLKKEDIIHAVLEEECPMLADLDLDSMSKDDIVDHLASSCCPVLEKLSGIDNH